MTTPGTTRPAVALTLPAAVHEVVEGVVEAFEPRPRGRVLDLGCAEGRQLLSSDTGGADWNRCDTVVSVGGPVHVPDLSSSLTIVDIERMTMPTSIWPLRSFVALAAERVPVLGDGGSR